MDDTFFHDVVEGLSSTPKFLSSKYFYNKRGDELFQAIMGLPEYYLTRSEFEILTSHKEKLMELFTEGNKPFELIELGSGDGLKTKILLQEALEEELDFKYIPIDISSNVLDVLGAKLKTELPALEVEGITGDYFEVLHQLSEEDHLRKVVLFLGSTIGNLTPGEAIQFLKKLSANLLPGDLLLIGFDLMKNPHDILAAYNDKAGVTRAFNLNLLQRINDELNGNFVIENFEHFPTYNPQTGETKSFLYSTREQCVSLGEHEFHFDANEPIFMEVSQKFSLAMIGELAGESGFKLKENFFDCKHYFVDSLWEVR